METDSLPTDGQSIRLIPLPEVSRLTGCSRSSIYGGIANGTFAKPVKCGASSRWLLSEVEQWVRDRVAERDKAAA